MSRLAAIFVNHHQRAQKPPTHLSERPKVSPGLLKASQSILNTPGGRDVLLNTDGATCYLSSRTKVLLLDFRGKTAVSHCGCLRSSKSNFHTRHVTSLAVRAWPWQTYNQCATPTCQSQNGCSIEESFYASPIVCKNHIRTIQNTPNHRRATA